MRGETRRWPGRHPHLCASGLAGRSGRAWRYSAKYIGRCEPDRSVCGDGAQRAAAVFTARSPSAFQSVRSAHARGGTLLRQPRTGRYPACAAAAIYRIYVVAASLTGRFWAVGPNARWSVRRTECLRRFDNLNGPASGQSPPPTAFGNLRAVARKVDVVCVSEMLWQPAVPSRGGKRQSASVPPPSQPRSGR